MDISVNLEAQMGFHWPFWKQYVPFLESAGFHTIFRSDHFPQGEPPTTDALELVTSLTYIADHTTRVNFGTLVSPLSFRDPVSLARQAMSLNDLSSGRMILGVGAGWNEEEHRHFGYDLGSMKTRMDRLEEGLQVISSLLRSDQPVSFAGRFYRLENARLLPRPRTPTRLLVGGKGLKRTLPLVARYADIWNCGKESPERFRELNSRLDELILAEGRRPEEVRRTMMIGVMLYRGDADLERSARLARLNPMFADISPRGLLDFAARLNMITGGTQQVLEQMQALAEAGVAEAAVQVFIPQDFEGLELFAGEILPHFSTLQER